MRAISILSILLFSTLTVLSQTISTTALGSTSFCQNETLSVPYTITGVFNPGNIFSAQLSDASGSFASPTVIGTLASTSAGTITATLPNLLTSGTLYRIRVVADNPAIIGSDNGTDLTITGNATDPATFGANIWHAYCYHTDVYSSNPAAFDYSDYRGMYTDANVSFDSDNHFNISSNPSTAPGYVGCSLNNDRHIVQYKRKGFPCGYYTISIAGPGNSPGHDDAARLIIDGTVIWSSTGCCVSVPNVYSGFIGPNTEIEFTWAENGGQSYGRLTIDATPFPDVTTASMTICAGSTAILEASGASNYDWSLNSTHLVAPLNAATVDCTPPGGTPSSVEIYTVSTSDAATGCSASNTVEVTIDPNANVSLTPTSGSYCGTGSVDVFATGAYNYSWLPAAGVTVHSANGDDVTLNPATTTTYTATGSNNCTTDDEPITITVNVPTGNPNDFGASTWNVYCYNGNNFNTYMGMYVHNTLDFDTRDLWGSNSTPSNAPGYTGCPIPVDQHSFRYKRKGFDCGFYQLDIPNHDDQVNLIIDGVSVFTQNTWFGNVYKANVWKGYLDADSEIEYTVREGSGGSNGGLAFVYLFGPNNSANETVWNGKTSSDWFDASNWCSTVPSSTISAIIPYNVANSPQIGGAGAEVANIEIQTDASLETTGSNNLDVYGNFTKNGDFIYNTGSVSLVGTNAISLSSTISELSFYDIIINNSNVAGIDLGTLFNNKINITNNANFTNGIINPNANLVEFEDNATTSNTSDASHINGQVRKIGNDAFEFPVGKSGFYRPISISAPGNVTDHFTAEFFSSAPDGVEGPGAVTIENSIQNISDCEYWILDRTNGSANVNVTLSYRDYNNGCSGVSDVSSLSIARWDAGSRTWTNNISTATVAPSGIITTNIPITTFSPFTLATSNGANDLPIELINFESKVNGDNKVDLFWQTASEINNDYFTIERSYNGIDFEVIAKVKGAGNSTKILNYSTQDNAPIIGKSFYRLKQTDFDGTSSYSNIQSVNIQLDEGVSIYPNPIENAEEILNIKSNNWNMRNVTITDQVGRIVFNRDIFSTTEQVNISDYEAGVYFIIIHNGVNSITKRIVIQ